MFSPNLHTVAVHGALCIECRGCLRRGVMKAAALNEAARRLVGHDRISDMTNVDGLPFRCTGCGSADISWLIPLDDAEAQRFVAGGNVNTALASKPPPTGCGAKA